MKYPTGAGGTDIKVVADCMLKALVLLINHSQSSGTLREIHIVDTNETNVDVIKKRFKGSIPDVSPDLITREFDIPHAAATVYVHGNAAWSTSSYKGKDMWSHNNMHTSQGGNHSPHHPVGQNQHQAAVGGSPSPHQAPQVAGDFEIRLPHGTIVQAYHGDITKLPGVEVIVNAANERLDHIGGVAYAILRAAGRELQAESDKYVKQNGDVKVTRVAITGAGQLPYKKVIHAVGPMWSYSPDKDKPLLLRTFSNTFKCADEKVKAMTLACPPISSGKDVLQYIKQIIIK